MIKMFRTFALRGLIFASLLSCLELEAALPDQPSIEITPTSSAATTESDTTSVLSLPHIPLTVEFFTHGGYDDNFRTSQSGQSSWFVNGGGSLSYDLPSLTNRVTLRLGGDVTYFLEQTGGQKDDVNAYVDVSLLRNVSPRLKLDAKVYATYRTEPDFGSNVGADTRIGDYFDTLDSLKATYHWTERYATATSDRLHVVDYTSSSAQGNSLNRVENTVGQELRYDLLHEGNTIVLEYRFEIIDYESAPRNSITHYALVGLDQDFTTYLKLTARGGATFRDYSSQPDRTDPYFEGSLTYDGPHHSTLALRTSYGIEEPSAQQVVARTTFRIGLEYKYGLTDRITASFAGYYHHDENSGVIPIAGATPGSGLTVSHFSEDAFDISINLRYQINHRFSIDTGGQYSEVNSQQAGRDYSRLRTFAGLRVTF